MHNRPAPLNAPELLSRAERFRDKAAELLVAGRRAPEGTIKENFTVLVIEYDFLARELERLVAEIANTAH
jgi:hypothetical protein